MHDTTYIEGKPLFPRTRYDDIKALLGDRVRKTPDRPAYRWRTGRERRTVTKTYGDFWREIHAVGQAFLARGLTDMTRIAEGEHMRPTHAIGMVGDNSYGWIAMYLVALFGAGVAVPIDRDLKAEEAASIANRSELKVLAYSDSHRELARSIAELCPTLDTLIALDGADDATPLTFDDREVAVLDFSDLVAEGERLMDEGHTEFLDKEIHNRDIAAIFFTSGTTARSKGIMLSHRAVASCVYCGHTIIDSWGTESALSVLPLHHTYENSIGQVALWQLGTTICFNDSLRHVTDNLREWDIEILYMVPLILEMVHKKLLQAIEKRGKTKQFNFLLKLSKGLRKIGIDLRRPLFRQVREGIGPNLKSFMVGGAPLKKELQQFFWDIGFDVWNAYGLTECAPGLAIGNEKTIKAGAVGIPIATAKMRITTDSVNSDGDAVGELQVICDNIMLGYYRDPERTAAAFTDDGWFKTGDYGYFAGNNLFLTGRETSMIVLGNGKNVFPEELEELLRGIPGVTDAMLWGEENRRGQTDLCARLELDPDRLGELDADKEKAVGEKLDTAIREINAKLPNYKAINHFVWSPEPLVRTTTRKVKRRGELARIHAFLEARDAKIWEVSGEKLDDLED